MDLTELHLLRGPLGPTAPHTAHRPRPVDAASFAAVLGTQARQVKLSAHAQERLKSRNIQLDESAMARLSQAVDKAAAKGSRDSLVLMDDTAFVVSVKNRTVITAVDGSSLKDNVFTNIDSAVIG